MPNTLQLRRWPLLTLGAFIMAIGSPLATGAEADVFAQECTAPTWEQTNGHDAGEFSGVARGISLLPEPGWDQTSGYGLVEANRAAASRYLASE